MASDSLELDEIVPWGRSYDEYRRMFDLDSSNLPEPILDCGAGPSSFCSEANRKGTRVVAIDPIYRFSSNEIEQRFHEEIPRIRTMLKENTEKYVFDRFETPAQVIQSRRESLEKFLEDYVDESDNERYVAGSIENLDFPDGEFDLALSSHLLFLYDELLSTQFHLQAIHEALRVADEFRIFPLRNLSGDVSTHLEPVSDELISEGYRLKRQNVDYEFQKEANQMLVIN